MEGSVGVGVYIDAFVAGKLSISAGILDFICFIHGPKKAWPHMKTHTLENLIPWEERDNIL